MWLGTDSNELNADMAKRLNGRSLLSFSCGKDSIGAWLHMRPHFVDIVPAYLYLIPDLEFVEESLVYYEKFFGTKIIRAPHPSLYRLLSNLIFQAPENCRVVEDMAIQLFDYDEVFREVAEDAGFTGEYFTANGVRAADSLNRHTAMKRYGPVNDTRKVFYPIYDWNKARLLEEIKKSGVRLPIDYRYFGRTFDGLDWRFLVRIKEHFPRDYARILEFFPLAELELFRRGMLEKHGH